MHALFGRALRGLVLLMLAGGAAAQVSRYEPASGRLSIPSVSVGDESFTQVELQDLGGLRFALRAASPQSPAAPGVARFDPASGVVTLPAVQVGAETYLNVTLLHVGSQQFVLQSATALPAATREAVRALFAAADAQWATAVPASGAARMALADGCYLHDGRSRAFLVAETDTNALLVAARDAWRIGQRSSNLQVLAERSVLNLDRSVRRELDVQYDLVYADGSRAQGLRTTLVSGSSAGTPRCSTPQSGSEWRLLGNQRLAYVGVRPRVLREERHGTGVAAPVLSYRRELQFVISDPAGHASYAIVTGPGPQGIVEGLAQPFSLKLVSPRLLNSAPELIAAPSSHLNWLDDDPYRYCRRSGGGLPVVAVADCTGQGAVAFDWGLSTSTPDAAADAAFAAMGFAADGVYRVALYADDGWKTVNGHVGRLPLAVYHVSPGRLPARFVDIAGSGPTADAFPRLAFGGWSPQQVRQNLLSATPAPMAVSWNPPAPRADGRVLRLLHAWEYFQGPRTGNAGGAATPTLRYMVYNYPASTALSILSWPVSVRPPELQARTYSEFTLQYGDRNDEIVASRVTFN